MTALMPTVSIVIRARNEAALIGRCLSSLRSQQYEGAVDILVIDSGSSDRTVEIARSHSGVKVIEISAREFNYGATLNFGIAKTEGELVVALSAHCVPLHFRWLASLVAPFVDNPMLAGTFGRQVPWPESDICEAALLNSQFGTSDLTYSGVDGYKSRLEPMFANGNSCFRRSVAEQYPFEHLSAAEDRVWAYSVLSAGYVIRYVADASVYHSHQRSVAGYFRLGRIYGATERKLGLPSTRLTSFDCFGVRELCWQIVSWYRLAAHVRGRFRRAMTVLDILAKITARDIGEWFGSHGYFSGRTTETRRGNATTKTEEVAP